VVVAFGLNLVVSMIADANHWSPFHIKPLGLSVYEFSRTGNGFESTLGPGTYLLVAMGGLMNGLVARRIQVNTARRRGPDEATD